MGCADRSCYDLSQHTKATGVRLAAEKKLDEPVEKEITEVAPNKGLLGKQFKKEAGDVMKALQQMDASDMASMEAALSSGSVCTSIYNSAL